MDAENFDKAFKVLSNKVKDPQFTAQGQEISNLLKGNTPAVMNANLNYLPELLNDRLVKTNNYEKALDARRELNTIMTEYRAGKIYDGILEDIETYYQQAIRALNDYLKDVK